VSSYTYVIAYEEFFERRLGVDICKVVPAGPKRGAIDCELSNTSQPAPGPGYRVVQVRAGEMMGSRPLPRVARLSAPDGAYAGFRTVNVW
jgi:hypothetical protein